MKIAVKGPELTDVNFEEIMDIFGEQNKFKCNVVTVYSWLFMVINILICLFASLISYII